MKDTYKVIKNADGYANLQIGIIQQAITDYKRALRQGYEGKARALERWFLSSWGEMLSGGNGIYIIEQVRKEVRRKNGKKQN